MSSHKEPSLCGSISPVSQGPRGLLSVGLLLAATAGCLNNELRPLVPPEPAVATFVAQDYGFDGPDLLSGGLTVIRVANRGQEPHHVQFLKLPEGKNPADLIAALQIALAQVAFVEIPSWAKQMGGPNGVSPGGEAEATVYLDPGFYVLICVIPTKQGTPHVALGMQKALRVIGHGPQAPKIAGEYHLAMADFEFAVPERMTTGRHVFHVINRGSQPHEVSVVELAPGASVDDLVASFTPGAHHHPLPGKLVGGMAGLEPGGAGAFTVTLTPGHYGLLCLFPNPHSGTSHVSKGMTMNFTVE
jgi:hypothetical protein